MKNNINEGRRTFLKSLAAGGATGLLAACGKKEITANSESTVQLEPPTDGMTYRECPTTKDKVSLLGYGMMRLPEKDQDGQRVIDQEQVDNLVKYSLDHGVNYFDTAPVYCRGKSEESTGIALKNSGYPRDKYFIATKLSNFDARLHSLEKSQEMFYNSLKYLQTDYIDYLLLHSLGGGGMDNLHKRFLDNGVLDFLMAEREAGRIRNLGFSFHGDINVFDWLLNNHDKYHWDFVQIQYNYIDFHFNNDRNDRGTDAEYLITELEKRGIPAVIMEPLLGGRLANVPQFVADEMKERDPQHSIASWAFRFAGHRESVLTVLSGMTYMEHLKDNLITYSPLKPLTDNELEWLDSIARKIHDLQNIPCTACQYCMPCPHGIDIPGMFAFYNKCKNEGLLPNDKLDPKYKELRRRFLIEQSREVAPERQANHCIGCEQCQSHCPQNIRIPRELRRIDDFVEQLRRDNK